jgi:predicted GNAT family acetyltransferase
MRLAEEMGPARATYEALGYRRVGTFTTVLL